MSSRNVKLILLCEDAQHETFVRRFLKKDDWETRDLRVLKAPQGRGSGEQYVREMFPKELKAYRSKKNIVGQALVVMIDGDNHGAEKRLANLEQACKDKDIGPRDNTDRVAMFTPTWCIETWIAYLGGETIDEAKPDYPRLNRERECQQHVNALYDMCKENKLREPAPSSLEAACEEYRSRLK